IMSYNGDFQTYSKEAIKQAEKIANSKDKLISFIKDLPIESNIKWDLFVVLEEAREHMKKYVSLMKKILPIFNEIYRAYKEKVNEYGIYLTGFLNKYGAKGLNDISYSLIDPKLMDSEENNILISITGAYSIRIMGSTEKNYIAWGLKIEEAFKQMKEINENKTNERVQIFKNLGDKTRYEVVKLIAAGESSTKVIAEALNVSSATISYHLNNLVTSKIIKLDKYNGKYGYIIDYKLLEDVIWGFKEDLNFPRV
ncbi:MAG TPA: winged helix-turn-helix domain-containing protein, partial [Tissierellaceae bacterium]|nr:winged helix-turn-helix domain-containing protein [Tissierellaceae bacterium]